jgi:DNA-binding transcriptional LysR family regulator
MLRQLFGDKGIELNSVVRFDNAGVGRAALQAGAGMMLIREEYAAQGEREGLLAISPLVQTQITLAIAHQSSRKDDPLIQAFVEAAKVPWPEMKLTTAAHDA